ncbi:T9SS type A sorting domain-containing protein [Flavobacterium muglaense]|uniref:T9SS type A sorting domain-containing protein n=1 Tax=Flavobacterium muglaense TaxID=2764716 RepID=A0A923N1H9_9FLAO|nr:T9SS type A sorting domain-containing protein [Flavobacterium muglaense]MBC5838374.1 T9SS type A sorting domain-containing protein [Flavobacterium muglaense]MBC5844909.1 T9SS type A sorting domain-containing protein [Flavobacterium muglaense]
MKYLLLFFWSSVFYGQVLHHEMIATQGESKTLDNGLVISQTIGQQSTIGNYSKEFTVMQGFQQSLWSSYIASNALDLIATKTYPNPCITTISFEFSKTISTMITVHVFDLGGRLVFSGEKKADEAILSVDLSQLIPSPYLVHLYTDTFSYYTKIIKL